MEKLLETLRIVATWVALNTGYPMPDVLPVVQFRSGEEMRQMAFCTETPCRAENLPAIQIVALYEHGARRILLREGTDFYSVEHQGTLVHELTHYMQEMAGKFGRYCVGLLEMEAYEIEDKWLKEHGLPPIRRSPAIIMATQCIPGQT